MLTGVSRFVKRSIRVITGLILMLGILLAVGCDQADKAKQAPSQPAKTVAKSETDSVKAGAKKTAEKVSQEELEQQLLSALSVGRYRDDLDGLRERGVIRALVTYSQTDFFLDDGYIRGLQADALRAFQKQLNAGIKQADKKVTIKYIPVPFNRLIPALNEGVGDIAAALLTVTPDRKKQAIFATGGKMLVKELVVRHKDAKPISSLAELQGKTVYVLNGSSYAEHLKAFNNSLGFLDKKIGVVEADPLLLSEDLLELVNAGVMDYTVVDSYKAELWSQVLTNLVVEQQAVVSDSNQLGWAVRKDNPQLYDSLTTFIKGTAKKGTLLGNMLTKRYLGTTRWIKNPLINEERDKLNKLLPLFARYGDQYGLDPLALAAQAYQESRFDQSLTSHRGAVGIMQLLPSTAADKNVAIKDIGTAENNIHAGAKYVAFLRDRYFDDSKVSAADRQFFSWAAYNAGPGNVRKMRRRAEKMGLDPNRWFGQVEVAAMRVVGSETVNYVSRIFKYYTAYRLSSQILAEKDRLLQSITDEASACNTPICDEPIQKAIDPNTKNGEG